MNRLYKFIILILHFSTLSIFASSIPINLCCDFWTNPQGIDISNPVLSWTIKTNSEKRAMRQTAYTVLVASSLENLKKDEGDLWNSGKIQSSQMGQITYIGKTLKSSQQCWWKVKVWDEKGIESKWSEPSLEKPVKLTTHFQCKLTTSSGVN